MSTGFRWKKIGGALLLSMAVLCVGSTGRANADTAQSPKKHTQKKAKAKKPELPPLPSGPTGPVQQIPLDSIAAVPPKVSFENSQLTIEAPNSTLADILRAVRKQTGAEIEIPAAPERVVTHLGPGPAREVMADLLNGSRFNYVLLGSAGDDAVLTRVVLVAKSGPENMPANEPQPAPQQGITQVGIAAPPQQEGMPDGTEAEATDDSSADDNADQAAAEAEQPAPPADQPGVKTPQQMLQEMQQRQMQMQQQQPPGQPPVPGAYIPQQPPPPPQQN